MNAIMLSSLLALNVPNVDLLATVITLEDNTTKGMVAINNVVWNRAKENPKNIRKVLLKRYQFTKSLQDLVKKAKSRSNWNVAKSIAENTYKGKVHITLKGATHYHVYRGKIKCSPSWTHPSLGGKNYKCRIVAFIGKS
jgi:spore germination cell wall hydrolase CwlJ-like protein